MRNGGSRVLACSHSVRGSGQFVVDGPGEVGRAALFRVFSESETAGPLRLRSGQALRFGSTASRDRQDDDFVGELTERRPLCGSRGALQVPRLPPDFLSGLVASVNFMRLSLKKAAYVGVYESSVVGNPECARDDKWRVVTFIKDRQIGWTG